MKRRFALLLSAALLGGCGGGIYLGWSSDNDSPPSVSLASGVTTAAPGQIVHLAAAASDDNGVAEVDFYRIDASGNTVLLGYDSAAPYAWDTTVPSASAGTVIRFFARAIDNAGQTTDSSTVAITVQ